MIVHKTTRQYYEKYQQMAKQFHITLKNTRFFPNKQELLKLYEDNNTLNNIPLHTFDNLLYTRRIYHPETCYISLAENVNMYKHLIIYELLEAQPKFID